MSGQDMTCDKCHGDKRLCGCNARAGHTEVFCNNCKKTGGLHTQNCTVYQAIISIGQRVVDSQKYSHYHKKCPFDGIDVYRILLLFNVTDPCLQHAIKKLLVAGGRGKGDINQDIREAIDTLIRWQVMRAEESSVIDTSSEGPGLITERE